MRLVIKIYLVQLGEFHTVYPTKND